MRCSDLVGGNRSPLTFQKEIAALLARLTDGLSISAPTTGAVLENTNTPPPQVLDADARNALHTQAVAVLNVKALVPVTLDLAAANYSRWRGLFIVILGKYALTDHVASDVPLLDQADWTQMECVVLDWLYGTISHDLLQEVMSPTASARTVWRDLEFQFLGNRELRAVNLSAEFHTFQQGDLSVTEYCRRLRTMADSLADLGEPQSDRTLVLTLINGLSPKYGNMQSLLPMQVPFPSFLQARSQLLLEEITKGHRPASEPATAFVASTAGARTAQNIPNNQGGGGGGGSSGNNSRNRRRGRGNGGGNSGQGSGHGGQTAGSQGGQGTGGQLAGQQASAPRQAQQWPTPFNPWAGTIHMWPGQAPSILGRPPFAGAVFPGLQTSPAYSAGLGQFGQPGALPPHASLPPLQ
ncbi:hypothetical protein OsI_12090 [Oryza sativa Indica Group]|uniref:Retrotransposon protein, putative, unclassified n=1 Tax=Oryza sativa subsp. indica TaxID=39946 RepID=A2XI38_ORYSI|nr:hypothetical protein OsI_12090 [Oryza sativa Indica Group]